MRCLHTPQCQRKQRHGAAWLQRGLQRSLHGQHVSVQQQRFAQRRLALCHGLQRGGRRLQRRTCPVKPSAGTGTGTPANAVFAALYAELKRSARGHMRKEYAGHTLSATGLTHETWFRLTEQTRTQWALSRRSGGAQSALSRRSVAAQSASRASFSLRQ